MKNTILLFLLFSQACFAEVKISQLPLGTASATTTLDVYPFVSATTGNTEKMRVWDLPNLPPFQTTFATKLSLTGGTLTGNLITAGGNDTAPGLAIGFAGTGFAQTGTSNAQEMDWIMQGSIVGAWLWNRTPGTIPTVTTTGNISTGTQVITGLATVSGISTGMSIFYAGAKIPATAIVASIDSATQITYTAQSGGSSSASLSGITIVFSDIGNADMVVGSDQIQMGISESGHSLALNSSDWSIPSVLTFTGGSNFSDNLWIGGDSAVISGFGAGVLLGSRSTGIGISDDLFLFTGAHITPLTSTATTTAYSTGLTSVTTTNLLVGAMVVGTGVPSGTVVSAIPSGSTVTMSQKATASGSVSLNFLNPAARAHYGQWSFGAPGAGDAHVFYGSLAASNFISTSANPASSGALAFAYGNTIAFRNQANTGNLTFTAGDHSAAHNYLVFDANWGGIDLSPSSGDFIGRSFWSASANISGGGILRVANSDVAIGIENHSGGGSLFINALFDNSLDVIGFGHSGSVYGMFNLNGQLHSTNVANETTGAGTAVFGASNCPAVTCTAVYKWVTEILSDGSTVYRPVFK